MLEASNLVDARPINVATKGQEAAVGQVSHSEVVSANIVDVGLKYKTGIKLRMSTLRFSVDQFKLSMFKRETPL